jgi:hypothetical protein
VVEERRSICPSIWCGESRVMGRATRALVLIALLFYLTFIARSAFVIGDETYFSLFDDAMISMRYAQNLANGDGLVWNPGGEAVQGFTNPLWTVFLSLLHLLPIPESKISLAVMLCGVVLLVLHLLVIRKIVRAVTEDSPIAELVAVGITALYYPLAFWTLRGMEVGTLALTVSAAVLAAIRLERSFSWRRALWALLFLVLGALLRPDGIVPFGVIWLFIVWMAPRRERLKLVMVGCSAGLLVVVGLALFGYFYYGDPLPNTFYLKVFGYPMWQRILRGAGAYLSVFALHLFGPVLWGGAALLTRRDKPVLMLGAVFVSQCLYSVYVGGDAWEWMRYSNRYVTVGMPMLFVLCGVATHEVSRMKAARSAKLVAWYAWPLALVLLSGGVIALSGRSYHPVYLGRYNHFRFFGGVLFLLVGIALIAVLILLVARSRRWGAGKGLEGLLERVSSAELAAVVLVLLLATSNGYGFGRWLLYNAEHIGVDIGEARLGVHLRRSTPEATTVAVLRAGAAPYFSHRRSIDMLGKNDRIIAKSPVRRDARGELVPGHNKWDLQYSIATLRPDVITRLGVTLGREEQTVLDLGYEELPNRLFVSSDSDTIDREALGRAW